MLPGVVVPRLGGLTSVAAGLFVALRRLRCRRERSELADAHVMTAINQIVQQYDVASNMASPHATSRDDVG